MTSGSRTMSLSVIPLEMRVSPTELIRRGDASAGGHGLNSISAEPPLEPEDEAARLVGGADAVEPDPVDDVRRWVVAPAALVAPAEACRFFFAAVTFRVALTFVPESTTRAPAVRVSRATVGAGVTGVALTLTALT